jgi:hypothetical protein
MTDPAAKPLFFGHIPIRTTNPAATIKRIRVVLKGFPIDAPEGGRK